MKLRGEAAKTKILRFKFNLTKELTNDKIFLIKGELIKRITIKVKKGGKSMKTAVRVSTLVVGLLLIMAMGGCPKKCVKPVTEEPVMIEEPVEEPQEKPAEAPPRLTLNLQTIYFDFDKSDIRPGDAQIIQSNADQIKQGLNQGQKFTVTIEGHCCPIGTSEYNMALGQRRAEAAKAYLVKLGVDGTILNTISYGEERLVTTDESQYHLNRRCEFKVTEK